MPDQSRAVPFPAPGWISPDARRKARAAVTRAIVLLSLVVCGLGCPGPEPVACRVGADCASGVCLRDGRCAAPEDVDAGTDAGAGGGDAGQGGDDAGTGGGAGLDGGQDAGTPVGCLPNHDGTIERGEVFFQAGLRATFRVSEAAPFSTAGTASGDGGYAWNFDTALAGDAARLVETRALAGEWYEAEYPDAGYVSELGQGSDLLGVFSSASDGLYLQGVVSPTDGTTSTRLRYEPWVKVLQFPLREGDAWQTDTTVSGRYQGYVVGNAAFGTGLPFQREVYASTVDRVGGAVTPYSSTAFPVLRVRTVMERFTRVYTLNPWYSALTLRSFTWNTECFGTVASVTSTDNESSTEFTSAAEVRRLSR